MKRLVAFLTVLVLFCISNLNAQARYGKTEGYSIYLGTSIIGPEICIGSTQKNSDSYGEVYFIYHAYDWESDEELWNKPSSGGYHVGLNYLSGIGSTDKFKWLLGGGLNIWNERLGSNASWNYGEPTEGYYQSIDLHIGGRYFLNPSIATTFWIGYAISTDISNTMLSKYPISGIEDSWSKLEGNLNILIAL